MNTCNPSYEGIYLESTLSECEDCAKECELRKDIKEQIEGILDERVINIFKLL